MDRSELDVILPAGFVAGTELRGAGAFGRVFEVADQRLQAEPPATRVARVVHVEEGEDGQWQERLLERLQQLSQAAIPHVSTPLAAGTSEDGSVYLITDRYDQRLWDRLKPTSGLDQQEAVDLLWQVLRGLAGLHRRGIFHGDVRSKNVFLSVGDSRPTAWLGDAAIGPMTWWTAGRRRDRDANKYRQTTHEDGFLDQPSAKGDLYALAIVACEMFLGRDIEREAADTLPRRLKESKVPASARRLIQSLLAAPGESFDANDALRQWEADGQQARRRQAVQFWGLAGAAPLAVVLMLIIGIQAARNSALRTRLDKTAARIGTLEETKEALSSSVELLESQNAGLEAKVARLEAEIARPKGEGGVVDAAERAQQQWSELMAGGGSAPWDVRSRAEKLRDQWPEEHRDLFVKWHAALRSMENLPGLRTWCQFDEQLRRKAEAVAESPWDGALRAELLARHDGLAAAAARWKSWAENDDLSWSDVLDSLGLLDGKPEAEFLKQWCASLQEKRDWTLRLKRGAAGDGFSKFRIVRLYVDEDQSGDANAHAWSSSTAHDYEKDGQHNSMQFRWKPGQSFGVSLEDNGYLYNGNILDKLYTRPLRGPLAIWRANFLGRVKQGKAELRFEILDCPGPPPEVYR